MKDELLAGIQIADILQAFSLGRLLEAPQRLPQAWSNQTFRLVTEEAGAVVVKVLVVRGDRGAFLAKFRRA